MVNYLLHDENFSRIFVNGKRIKNWIQTRTQQIANATEDIPDPNISIVIRSRNDSQHIRRLLADIKEQIFNGNVEIILVDTESRDDTATYAKSQGAKIISLSQEGFTYPKALNIGFQAVTHPWVLTIVGHSSLSSRLFLKSLSYWINRHEELGGIYGLPLANWNATKFERLENVIGPRVWKEPTIIRELSIGIMGANCSIVKREVWQQLGGYDEHYAGGGEDRAFARSMLDHKLLIVREPLCSVFHSHGLGPGNAIRQWLHWGEVGKKVLPFETAKVHRRRPDLR